MKDFISLPVLVSVFLGIWALDTNSWIVYNVAGTTRFGLKYICIQFLNLKDEEFCEKFNSPSFWVASFIFIIIGLILDIGFFILLILSRWHHSLEKLARLVGVSAMTSFYFAAILFPCGFSADEIGGEPYKLPPTASIGYSFFLFYASLILLTMVVFFYSWSIIRRIVLRDIR
ncbi:uncharacterized protein C16orf52 homolog A isoform X4 [Hydra vulgaris]|uniref:Uncharacterized protein C16orf52 homolog A isoform X4 n=1 Tax=Hydra vulgaris TaxID=6087 RepID=A0ABM4CDS0_HYDVU